MTDLRTAAQQALEALGLAKLNGKAGLYPAETEEIADAITNLRAALAEPVQTQQENKMPITDDNGQALRPQYRVIEQRGSWFLLYDQMQVGEAARHEFRIQKLRHDIALYPGITLAEAQKRFHEKVEADHE